MNQASKETEELKTTEQQDRAPGHRPYEDIDAALGILDQDQPRVVEFLFCMG